MSVRLAVPAVGAANRRLDHALAVWCWRKEEEAPMARVSLRLGPVQLAGLAQGRAARVSSDRVANEIAELLIRDFH